MLDNNPISTKQLEIFYGVNGKALQQQYKHKLSEYSKWEQQSHAEFFIFEPKNISPRISLDETALSNGELYTILTNKEAKGKKGSLIAMVKGTKAEAVINVFKKIPKDKRDLVKSITVDMAHSMNLIAKTCFSKASITIDRFHVQQISF